MAKLVKRKEGSEKKPASEVVKQKAVKPLKPRKDRSGSLSDFLDGTLGIPYDVIANPLKLEPADYQWILHELHKTIPVSVRYSEEKVRYKELDESLQGIYTAGGMDYPVARTIDVWRSTLKIKIEADEFALRHYHKTGKGGLHSLIETEFKCGTIFKVKRDDPRRFAIIHVGSDFDHMDRTQLLYLTAEEVWDVVT